METPAQTAPPSPFLDKKAIQGLIVQQNELIGFIPDPAATAEKAQAMSAERLRAQGIRPEDNYFSCAIIAARDED